MPVMQRETTGDLQHDKAILLQECAQDGKYKNAQELCKHAAYIGASYTVLAWVDRYCHQNRLYTEVSSND